MNDNEVDNLDRPLAAKPALGALGDERGEPRQAKQFKRDKRDVHGWLVLDKSVDPYSYVISANIRRRHLTAEQKRVRKPPPCFGHDNQSSRPTNQRNALRHRLEDHERSPPPVSVPRE